MLIQVVLVAVLFSVFVVTWRRARERVISRRAALAWSVLWLSAGVAVIHPDATSVVARAFGVGRGADFSLYASAVLLFVLVFRIFVALDRLERKLTDLVRKDALRDLPETKETNRDDAPRG